MQRVQHCFLQLSLVSVLEQPEGMFQFLDIGILLHWQVKQLYASSKCVLLLSLTPLVSCTGAYLQSCFLHEQLNTFIVLAWLGFVARFAGKTDVVKMHVGLPPDITFPLRWMSVGTNKDETVEINDANKVRKKPFGFKTSVYLQIRQRMYQNEFNV